MTVVAEKSAKNKSVEDEISSFGADVSAMDGPASASDESEDAASNSRKKRVLMLTHRMPYPPDRGDRIRSYHLLKLLSKHFDIALACTSNEPSWLQHHQLLSTMADRVELQPITDFGSNVRGVRALVTGHAITPASFYRQGLADAIRRWHEQAPFDAVLTFCTGMVHYARLVTQPQSRRNAGVMPGKQVDAESIEKVPVRHVLDLVDVDSQKWASYAEQSRSPMKIVYGAEATRLRRIESGQFDHFDAVTVVSQTEADCYKENVGDHAGLQVVGNGVDMRYFSPQPDSDSHKVVFVGVLDYKPNYEGVAWFVEHVLPRLRKRVADAEFMIVGRNPTTKVKQLSLELGVNLVGSVPDVRSYLAEAAAVIAPLRIARGVQNKVLEAMSCQRPVVCSPGAAEGIDATTDKHFLVADHPDRWADYLEKLLTDKSYRQSIAAAARKRIEECYTWEEQLKPMIQLLGGENQDAATAGVGADSATASE